ncbi:hypothetical protein SteCoe_11483 [Stentor coeruleus]|uniref:Uncharacterized protein n=1 Tax=Stentor coeruleus TaxID=5963 RepID=A0A1R2CD36_9CILI|nr:hypothetical protein SteCoe_11483 [Stentor coeruleus]
MSDLSRDFLKSPCNSMYFISVLEPKETINLHDIESQPRCSELDALSVDYDQSLFHAQKKFHMKLEEHGLISNLDTENQSKEFTFYSPQNKVFIKRDFISSKNLKKFNPKNKLLQDPLEVDFKSMAEKGKPRSFYKKKFKIEEKTNKNNFCTKACEII